MRTIQRLWTVVAGTLCALGLYAGSAAANSYDQVELHSGSSSGPVWSGNEVFSGTSSNFIYTGGFLTITCSYSTGSGTVDSADVGHLASQVYRRTPSAAGCPGISSTTWTITAQLPWSIHQLYDQTTNRFVTVIDAFKWQFAEPATTCLFVGSINNFSDIGQASAIVGSQSNPASGNAGSVTYDWGSSQMLRLSGNTLICGNNTSLIGTYMEKGQHPDGTLFNLWQLNQGARVQG
jgi:hypothetical protein